MLMILSQDQQLMRSPQAIAMQVLLGYDGPKRIMWQKRHSVSGIQHPLLQRA